MGVYECTRLSFGTVIEFREVACKRLGKKRIHRDLFHVYTNNCDVSFWCEVERTVGIMTLSLFFFRGWGAGILPFSVIMSGRPGQTTIPSCISGGHLQIYLKNVTAV